MISIFQLTLLTLILNNIYHVKSYCYINDEKSPYIRHFSVQSPVVTVNKNQYNIPGCKSSKVWVMVRHGTHYPGGAILNFSEPLNQIRDDMTKTEYICQQNYVLLKNWQLNTSFIPENLAYPQGWVDERIVAQSWQNMYPNLFDNTYSPQTYKFGHDNTQRTLASFQAFTQGLFGDNVNYNNIPRIISDVMIMPYINCNPFMKLDDLSKLNNIYTHEFEKTKEYRQVMDDVFQMLGLNRSTHFNSSTVYAMFLQCTFAQSINLQTLSPWCAVFNLTSFRVLEYLTDIYEFNRVSYGVLNQINKLPCVAIRDMLEYLKDSSDDPTKVTAYFSHSTMLLIMLTTFGNFYDPLPLSASNYEQQQNRKFKSNIMSPFAANIAAVKYECPSSESKILFLHNQQPLSMTWCKLGSICTIDEIQKFYENSPMKNCPCDVCGNEFAIKSKANYPQSLLKTADFSCIKPNHNTSKSKTNLSHADISQLPMVYLQSSNSSLTPAGKLKSLTKLAELSNKFNVLSSIDIIIPNDYNKPMFDSTTSSKPSSTSAEKLNSPSTISKSSATTTNISSPISASKSNSSLLSDTSQTKSSFGGLLKSHSSSNNTYFNNTSLLSASTMKSGTNF